MDRLSVAQRPRAGDDYPFLGESHGWNNVIFDLLVQYDPTTHVLPLRITTAPPTIVGGKLMVTIVDSNDAVVFDTNIDEPRIGKLWGDTFTVNTWARDYRVLTVIYRTDVDDGEVPSFTSAVIDPRTAVPLLSGVLGLSVVDRRSGVAIATEPGSLVTGLAGGYNVSVSVSPLTVRSGSGDRLAREVQLAAIPGAGQGRLNTCDDELVEPVLRKINNVGTETGHFLLTGDACIQAIPDPGGSENSLVIQDNCDACCDCNDYLAVARGLVRTADRMTFLEQVVQTLQDDLTDQVSLAGDLIECHKRPLQLRVTQYGNCGMGIVAGYLNRSLTQQEDIILELRFYKPADPDAEVTTWVPSKISNFAEEAMIYRDATHIAMTKPAILDNHRIRFSVGCAGTGRVVSALVTPWLLQRGRHLICLSRILPQFKNTYTVDNIGVDTEATCVEFDLNCNPAVQQVAARMVRLGIRT